jgi:carbon-monoxide dehydrogenase large subunit
MLDLAAAELDLDRAEIRRRNLIAHEKLPYRSPMGLTYDSGEFARNMTRALELAEWKSFDERRAAARANGKLRGIGLANYIESPVGAPRERIELTVLPEGRVDIVAGTQSTGQGHETTFAQVIAEHLGVPMASVTLRTGDTAFVSVGGGSHSDRSMRLGGMLLVDTAAQIVATARRVAAALFDVSPERVTFADGGFADPASDRRIDLFEVAARIASDGVPGDPAQRNLSAHAEVNTRVPAHPTGAAVCELEVDPDTGVVKLVNYTSVDDVGQPINPLIVEGQVHGGLAQGIGQALSETCYLDRETGQVLTGSYMDYGMPRAGAIPPLRVELTEDPTHGNPLRVKGGGESGITPATATIFNALADALKEFGNEELAMPATPKVVWEYIHRRAG